MKLSINVCVKEMKQNHASKMLSTIKHCKMNKTLTSSTIYCLKVQKW